MFSWSFKPLPSPETPIYLFEFFSHWPGNFQLFNMWTDEILSNQKRSLHQVQIRKALMIKLTGSYIVFTGYKRSYDSDEIKTSFFVKTFDKILR